MDTSADRITDVWSSRTPYEPGTSWPSRTDAQLAEGLGEQDVERWVQAASLLHSNGDAMDIAVREGRIVGVRAGPRTGSTAGASAPRTSTAGRRTPRRTGSPGR